MANARKELPAQDAEATAPAVQAEHHQTQDASKRPIWSRTINRVDCSIWSHDQAAGKRYTVAISRSYLEKRSNQWKHSYYFDKSDLQDVRAVCDAAENELLELEGMTDKPGED